MTGEPDGLSGFFYFEVIALPADFSRLLRHNFRFGRM